MRFLLLFLLFITPAYAIYNGVEEKDPNGLRRFMVWSESGGKQSCSGVLIAKDIIAVPAYCAMQSGTMEYFMLGKTMTPQKLESAHAIIHPDFNPAAHWNTNGSNNIGLIRLKKPTQETQELFTQIRTAMMNKDETALFAGFGRQQVEDALSNKKLRSFTHKFAASHAPSQAITRNTALEISADNPIPAACAGDFGGGVFTKNGEKTELIGLIQSYDSPKGTISRTCGGVTFFTWLSPIDAWIKSAIKELRERPLK